MSNTTFAGILSIGFVFGYLLYYAVRHTKEFNIDLLSSAIGALGAIHDAGLEVPRDVSLIGFDDISFAHLTQPPLTTILLSRSQLAITALAALEKLIRKESGEAADYFISTHLVMRSSTRTL